VSKRGENIYKRKDGRWEGRYIKDRTVGGKAIYGYVYAYSYKETRTKLQDAIRDWHSSEQTCQEETETTDFQSLAEEWFCHMKPLVKESTYRKYSNLWQSYIRPQLGHMQIPDISQSILEEYCTALLTSGGSKGEGLSAKTVSDTMSLIRCVLQFCISKKIVVSCDTRMITVKQCTKKMRVLTVKEQQILCNHIYSDLSPQNVGVLFCLFTGIRVGEICALKWEDISFSENTVHIHQTMQRIQIDETENKTKIIITTPKSTCSIRTIPLPDELISVLKTVRGSASGYFLTGSDKRWIEPRTMQYHFKSLLKRCKIEDANYHALRHTFATRCVELGFDVKSLSEILGHASVNITMNRYVHPSMNLKRKNMERLSGLFSAEQQGI
jgi:integrase